MRPKINSKIIMRDLIGILLLVLLCKCAIAANSTADGNADDDRIGEPLFLTDYIEKGRIAEARRRALVRHADTQFVESYSGFITVNKTYNSNTFFWFILSQSNPKDDPLVLWMDGGPGSSSMAVIFNYNGPFIVNQNNKFGRRKDTITKNHNVIYVDNPLGAGFSFTESESGYSRNQDDVGRNVLNFLLQFFKLFPEFQRNDFYVGGDSYGGKYTVTMSRFIDDYNNRIREDKVNNSNTDVSRRINLHGLIVGNGFIDPPTQQVHADFLYYIGLVDENEREQVRKLDERMVKLGVEKDTLGDAANVTQLSLAFQEEMMSKRELITKLTGYSYIHNYLTPSDPADRGNFLRWITTPGARRALHVADKDYDLWSETAAKYLWADTIVSVAPVFAKAIRKYKVLAYNGQLDMDFPYSSTQKLYRKIDWPGSEDYRSAKKKRWFVDGELAGYAKQVGNFTEVVVRNAGHVAAYEQPARVCDLITHFTRGVPLIK